MPDLPERWQRYLAITQCNALHMYGRHDQALATLNRTLGMLRTTRLSTFEHGVASWLAERQALHGDIQAARATLRQADLLNEAQQLGEDTAQKFSSAVVNYAAGAVEEARTGFKAALQAGNLYIWDQARAYAFLMVLGEEYASELHGILQQLGHAGPFLTDSRLLSSSLTSLRDHPLLGDWITPLTRGSAVHVTLYGEFRLSVGHQHLHVSLRKSRELLAYLLLRGPASRTELLTALWPDASGAAVEYFKQAVKRLREELEPLVSDGRAVESRSGRYQLAESIRWITPIDPRPVFPGTAVQVNGELDVAPFLEPFHSPWVEDVRPAMHALLAQRVMTEPAGDLRLQRLRLLHQLLPDDSHVQRALITALEEAGLAAEAQATQAAYTATLLSWAAVPKSVT